MKGRTRKDPLTGYAAVCAMLCAFDAHLLVLLAVKCDTFLFCVTLAMTSRYTTQQKGTLIKNMHADMQQTFARVPEKFQGRR
jgi:hypothetical protein